ncbi:SDR family NAD(P)-dependent oxidoreductase [Streptomyces sp. NPDC000594]|uniref:SDR family NAD(P)-dependent oxidoreductase n=1 Tax=Streptomyces sp. NPDC000594 TaxID=3154261 RepID=UPI00331CE67F
MTPPPGSADAAAASPGPPGGLTPDIAPDAPGRATALLDCGTGERTSYAALTALTHGVTGLLTRDGSAAGETVALLLGNGAPFAAAYYGTLWAGGTVLPLDPLAPPAEWRRALLTTGARRLVTTRAAWRALEELPGALSPLGRPAPRPILVDADEPVAGLRGAVPEDGDALPVRPPDPGATAVLASSSGTGGPPKLVRLTHGNLAANLTQIHARHHLGPEDVVLAVTPWRHIFGMQMALNHTLRTGGTLAFTTTRFDLEDFLRAVQEHRITIAYLAPPIVVRLATDPAVDRYDLSSLRRVFSGGAPLAPEAARACSRRVGAEVYQGFGMTEAGCTHLVPDGVRAPAGSVGLPLPGTGVRVTDPATGDEVPAGAEGELWVRGPQISPGVFAGPGEEPAALTDAEGWLRTGDLARVDAAGFCTVTGRLKELIKYNGHQISPSELEAVLLAHPDVADAAVVGVPDPVCGELPTAFVVLRRTIDPAVLLDHVGRRVAPQRRIRAVETLSALPRNATGKVLRAELIARGVPATTAKGPESATYPTHPAHAVAPVTPMTPVTSTAPVTLRAPAASATSRVVVGPGVEGPLEGRTALVTGGGRGLGLLFAGALADAGARVVITGRDPATLEEAAERLGARGAQVLAVPADVRDPGALTDATARALDTFGGLDLLVNNAGITGPHGPLWEVAEGEWWQAMETNLRGTARACRAVVPAMVAAGKGGRIINVVSRAGRVAWPLASAYSVSKAAVIMLTETLAGELRPQGIGAFSFHPGLIDIGVTREHMERHPTGNPWTDRVGAWLLDQRGKDAFTPPDRAAAALLRLARGEADALSGRYLTTDALLAPPGAGTDPAGEPGPPEGGAPEGKVPEVGVPEGEGPEEGRPSDRGSSR